MSTFTVLKFENHPNDSNFEIVKFNNRLELVRCKSDGLYQVKSIAQTLNSNYQIDKWFNSVDNQRLITILHESGRYGSTIEDIHQIKKQVHSNLRGHYIHEMLVYNIAMACDKNYAIEVLEMINEMHNIRNNKLLKEIEQLQSNVQELQSNNRALQTTTQIQNNDLFNSSVRSQTNNNKRLRIYKHIIMNEGQQTYVWRITSDSTVRIDPDLVLFDCRFPASINIKQDLRKARHIITQNGIRDVIPNPQRTIDVIHLKTPKLFTLNQQLYDQLTGVVVDENNDENNEENNDDVEDIDENNDENNAEIDEGEI